jgi:3-hydroxyacyl-CoA dehydrogenase
MFYADQVGLKHIADRLSFYAKETSDPSLEPAPLLKRLAAEGKTFASLTETAKAA